MGLNVYALANAANWARTAELQAMHCILRELFRHTNPKILPSQTHRKNLVGPMYMHVNVFLKTSEKNLVCSLSKRNSDFI